MEVVNLLLLAAFLQITENREDEIKLLSPEFYI
jgi:hypothetical protein